MNATRAVWAAFFEKQKQLGGDEVPRAEVLDALIPELVSFLDRYRDAGADHEVHGAGRRGESQPSRLLVEVSNDDFAQGLRVTLEFGVRGAAVPDDEAHADSVASEPWDAS